MSIVSDTIDCFKGAQFILKQADAVNPDTDQNSIRVGIYENLARAFAESGREIYATKDRECLVIEGNGRDLSGIEDESIDCIITDHPWDDRKATSGGNRNFASYDCFEYNQGDFNEKARVLKKGSFLCEVIPAESETNFDYLYQIKKMAQNAGFRYYSKVAWKKGKFVSNTGRKAKNTEDLMIFSKGKPRALRPDKQRGVEPDGTPTQFMSGANGMLPAMFDVQAVPTKNRLAQSEKPAELFEQLLDYLTKEGELVMDQFAGSGAVGEACIRKKRKCILVEKDTALVKKITGRIGAVALSSAFRVSATN